MIDERTGCCPWARRRENSACRRPRLPHLQGDERGDRRRVLLLRGIDHAGFRPAAPCRLIAASRQRVLDKRLPELQRLRRSVAGLTPGAGTRINTAPRTRGGCYEGFAKVVVSRGDLAAAGAVCADRCRRSAVACRIRRTSPVV